MQDHRFLFVYESFFFSVHKKAKTKRYLQNLKLVWTKKTKQKNMNANWSNSHQTNVPLMQRVLQFGIVTANVNGVKSMQIQYLRIG